MIENLIDFLKKKDYAALTEELSIDVKVYDDRLALNYNQKDSPKHHPIADLCRGLIVSLPDYKILCRSFDRFYNWHEDPLSDQFDITQAFCYKKVDGSLLNVYHYKQWEAATRKMAFAEGVPPYGGNVSFRQL